MLSNDLNIEIKELDNGDFVVSVSGRLSIKYLDDLLTSVRDFFSRNSPSSVKVDLKNVTYMDSAGALFLLELEYETKKRHIPLEVINLSNEYRGMLELIDKDSFKRGLHSAEKIDLNLFEQIGYNFINFLMDIKSFVTFIGALIVRIFSTLTNLQTLRWEDFVLNIKKAGVDGLPIVGLISFLLGLIIAFMSSLQLKQFGANVYVPTLLTIAMVKELGPIMTAIIVAGRTGSSFAAEIGTMKVNEEVDALVVMGFDPIKFLAIPKVFATMVVVPFLTVFSDLFAILGGLIVGVLGLDITVHTYIQQTVKAIKIFDIITSLIKSTVFALLIAGVGCQRGFEVKNSAEEVGMATTSAVVSSLFLIIVADSMFAIALRYIR